MKLSGFERQLIEPEFDVMAHQLSIQTFLHVPQFGSICLCMGSLMSAITLQAMTLSHKNFVEAGDKNQESTVLTFSSFFFSTDRCQTQAFSQLQKSPVSDYEKRKLNTKWRGFSI